MNINNRDREKLRKLLKSSGEVQNLLKKEELDAVFSGDPDALMKAYQSACTRNISVRLDSGHFVVYDVMLEGTMPAEHVSISHRDHPVTESEAITIATEFGLGDPTKWSVKISPKPPLVRAFHIIRGIT